MEEEIRKYEPQSGIMHNVPLQEEMGQGTDDKGLKPAGPEIRLRKKKVADNTIELKSGMEPKINDSFDEGRRDIEKPVKVDKTYQQGNTPREQDPIIQESEDFDKGEISDEEAAIFSDLFQYMYNIVESRTSIIKMQKSPGLIPEKKFIENKSDPRKSYYKVSFRHPETNKIVETHRYKKIPSKISGRLGGMALRDKWGSEHFKNIGKTGYKVTAEKIQDMIANPDKYPGITNEDIVGLAKFLKRRLNQTTDTYRNQFGRAWREESKNIKGKTFSSPEAQESAKKQAFDNASKKIFPEGFKPNYQGKISKDFPKQYEGEQAHENVGLENKTKTGDSQEPITAKSLKAKLDGLISKMESLRDGES